MTGFQNNTNDKRVQKILENLRLIEKSARANKAGPEQVTDLLKPVVDHIMSMGAAITEDAPSPPRAGNGKPAPYMTVKQMAEEASLPDLTYAMAVYLNRIDEHLKET
ncbi:hypothetical protein [uncultured Roseobacter sp.]|uniref:hypothetical protein n=1 Tax=uncultured Roseobacter sp. TaxID=114847 RepID=UPI002637F4D3|nr:hypothetical protein [uncultured Roseobacter sp.]